MGSAGTKDRQTQFVREIRRQRVWLLLDLHSVPTAIPSDYCVRGVHRRVRLKLTRRIGGEKFVSGLSHQFYCKNIWSGIEPKAEMPKLAASKYL